MSTSTTHTSGPPTSGCHVNDPHFWTTYIWLSCQRPTLLDHLHLVVMSTTHTSGPPTSGCHVNDPHLWTTYIWLSCQRPTSGPPTSGCHVNDPLLDHIWL